MNEKIIWDYLIKKINNPYGVAAIMGNLMAESSLNPANATGKNKTANYVDDVNNGWVDFAHDGVAFGLVQWCYWSRKQGLLDFAKARGKSIDDLTMQLDYMLQELQSYKTVLAAVTDAKDVRTPSDVFMLKYEKPGNVGDAARQKRAAYGVKYYDAYAPKQEAPAQTAPTPAPAAQPASGKRVYITARNVNIRAGNGKEFSSLGHAQAGDSFPWVATAENGWHAIRADKSVRWVSGEFSKVVTG